MSDFVISLVEWGATLLSLAGFWLCIRHRPACFLFFLVADLGWFASAWAHFHSSLLAQQAVYLVLNGVGYVMWRREEARALDALERRELKSPVPVPEAPLPEPTENRTPRRAPTGASTAR